MKRTCISFLVLGLLGASAAGFQDDSSPRAKRPEDKTTKKSKGKFTISKETTYVTGPLDKDGYIDYMTALNERLREGVTPDNNANVLLWKAFGPHPAGATMPAEFFKLMGIESPPEKGDYVVDSFKHAKKHAEIDPTKKAQLIFNDYYVLTARPWKTVQYPYVAGWLTANDKPLAVAVEATKRSHYFSPLVSNGTDKGRAGLIAALLPAVQKSRELANMLTSRAMLHLGEGRYDDAWQDLLACHRLGRLIAKGGTLIEQLVGIAIDHIAAGADVVFLDRAKLDGKRLKDCLRDLQALPPMPGVADRIDLAERFVMLESLLLIDRYGVEGLNRLGGVLGGGLPLPEFLAERLLAGIDWDPALRGANRWYDRLTAALRIKDRGERQRQLSRIDQEIKKLKTTLEKPENLAKILASDNPDPAVRGKLVGDIAVTLLMPGVIKVQEASDRSAQVQRNLHVAFALSAYQRDQRRYPKTLDELAPKYLAELPLDLFSGKALIYRPSEKGFLVYSVGGNGRDDGGRWYDDMPPGDDPRVRLPLPEAPRR